MAVPLLTEGQFSLSGVTFGGVRDRITIVPDGWDKGSRDVRDQDRPVPGRDGLAFGRDFITPGVWTFSLAVWDDVDCLLLLSRLRTAWDARTVRTAPGSTVPLYYREGGQTRVVYGRPRGWDEGPQKHQDRRLRRVTCSFQLGDALSYSAVEKMVRLDLVTTSAVAGVRFPLRFPTVFGRGEKTREGFAVIPAEAEGAPFKVTITGPVVGAVTDISIRAIPRGDRDGIYTPDMSVDLPGVTVAPGQTLTVDTNLGVVTRNGRPVTVGIGARSALRSRLPAGETEFVYRATDASATSTAVLSWRDTQPL